MFLCAFGGLEFCWKDAPFCRPGNAGLVPAPAHIGSADVDDCFGLQGADQGEISFPVVVLDLAVLSFTVGAVEPDGEDRAVVGEQLGELVDEEVVVGDALPVGGLGAIPRGQVDAEFEAEAAG